MDIYEMINETGKEEIADVLDSVLFRYKQLFPDWEISVVSIDKTGDKNEQLNNMIHLIQNMKE